MTSVLIKTCISYTLNIFFKKSFSKIYFVVILVNAFMNFTYFLWVRIQDTGYNLFTKHTNICRVKPLINNYVFWAIKILKNYK